MKTVMKTLLAAAVIALGTSAIAVPVSVSYTDWTSSGAGTVSGTIGSIGVTYSGDLAFAQTSGGINYWAELGNAFSAVANMPPSSDIVALSRAVTVPNTITFSSPVTDPIMLILSEGQPNLPVYYNFAQPFHILSSGSGYWGGDHSGSLFELPDNVLEGVEGHGVIQFEGTFSSISWTDNPDEYWHGLTIALPQRVPDGGMSAMLLGMGMLAVGMVRKMMK